MQSTSQKRAFVPKYMNNKNAKKRKIEIGNKKKKESKKYKHKK